jgi:hypothetical protein
MFDETRTGQTVPQNQQIQTISQQYNNLVVYIYLLTSFSPYQKIVDKTLC